MIQWSSESSEIAGICFGACSEYGLDCYHDLASTKNNIVKLFIEVWQNLSQNNKAYIEYWKLMRMYPCIVHCIAWLKSTSMQVLVPIVQCGLFVLWFWNN